MRDHMKVQLEMQKATPLSGVPSVSKNEAKLSQRLNTGRVNQNNHLLLMRGVFNVCVALFSVYYQWNLALGLVPRWKVCPDLDGGQN